jgi:hypothetical protein
MALRRTSADYLRKRYRLEIARLPPRLGLAAALSALALLAAVPAAGRTDGPDLKAYAGLGTWIDIYSPSFRSGAGGIAAALARHQVRTLFVETGNFRQRADIVAPQQLGRLIEAAHARHIAVVGWYLPDLTNPVRELRRALAAVHFVSSAGEKLDSFALDIESSAVRNVALRTRRLLMLSARLRAAVGPQYALGAIIPSPVGMRLLPRYWPSFPYAALVRRYDVFLPMTYFTYRAHGSAAVARYVQTSVGIIRAETGDETVPIHLIGGLADVASRTEAAAFVRAAGTCGVRGFSLYDFFETKASVWSLLTRAASTAPVASSC